MYASGIPLLRSACWRLETEFKIRKMFISKKKWEKRKRELGGGRRWGWAGEGGGDVEIYGSAFLKFSFLNGAEVSGSPLTLLA